MFREAVRVLLRILPACGLVPTGLAAGLQAATYHVAQTAVASDSIAGTEEAPWKTISRAASAKELKPGDSVLIHSGVYRESVDEFFTDARFQGSYTDKSRRWASQVFLDDDHPLQLIGPDPIYTNKEFSAAQSGAAMHVQHQVRLAIGPHRQEARIEYAVEVTYRQEPDAIGEHDGPSGGQLGDFTET